jgi:hypothetical protein
LTSPNLTGTSFGLILWSKLAIDSTDLKKERFPA